MKANLLPIGRMARLNHVTIATLRLYDRMGLLKPAPCPSPRLRRGEGGTSF